MNYREIDLNLLLILDAMYDAGSTTLVAERLKISQPTVSFSLGKLRDVFGDELFVRHGASMQPTPLAEAIREPVRRVVETVRFDILRERAFDPASVDRTFSLSASDIGELVFLPLLLERLRISAPKLNLRSLAMPPAELREAMTTGGVDLAIGYFPDLTGAGFFQQKLFEHAFTCLVRADHPTIGDSISMEQFLKADHVVVMQEGRSQEIAERKMAEMGLDRHVVLRSPHFMSVPHLVATSNLISIVPRAVGRAFMHTGRLKLLEPPFKIPHIELKQFWHRRVHTDPGVLWLRSLVAKLYLNRDPSEMDDSPIFGGKRARSVPSTHSVRRPASRRR
jgi:DNA-binding transcriptional LysR family regulator